MKINNLSETAVTLTFDDVISKEVNERVLMFHDFVLDQKHDWLIDIISAYTSITFFVDITFFKLGVSLGVFFTDLYAKFCSTENGVLMGRQRTVEIPVNYCGEDLDLVAEKTDKTREEVIELHSSALYTVAMIGFTPGFPYLLGLDKTLEVARKNKPRLKVKAGAVAIGGSQTGIYPRESPGGWNILGYTDLSLFDIDKEVLNLLSVGDKVKFIRI